MSERMADAVYQAALQTIRAATRAAEAMGELCRRHPGMEGEFTPLAEEVAAVVISANNLAGLSQVAEQSIPSPESRN